jgi:hypothetical protein
MASGLIIMHPLALRRPHQSQLSRYHVQGQMVEVSGDLLVDDSDCKDRDEGAKECKEDVLPVVQGGWSLCNQQAMFNSRQTSRLSDQASSRSILEVDGFRPDHQWRR